MINYLSKFNCLSIKLIRSRIRSGQELGQVICQNCHKSTTSVAIAHIRTKFGSETKTDVPETEITPNFTSAKIQDGGRPPFWKHINRHNSAARWAIFTKFGVEVDTGSAWLPVMSNFTSEKSKMAAAAILNIHLNGHNSVTIAHIRTKFGSVTITDVRKQKYLHILLPQKSKMAADCHLENT